MKRIKDSLLIALSILLAQTAFSQTNISGVISTNQVWDVSGSPYTITQNTYIDTFASVLVMPGVVVKDNGSKNKLIVDGGLRAVGTKDSMIKFEDVQVEYNASSKDYNASNGTGAYYKWCEIITPGTTLRGFYLRSTSIRFEHCDFKVAYYGIYVLSTGSSDTSMVEVNHCDFDHLVKGNGSTIYGSDGIYNITNSSFKNGRSIYISGEIAFQNNTVESYNSVKLNLYNTCDFQCNDIKHISDGITLQTYGNRHTGYDVNVNNNTLDSFGNLTLPAIYPMFEIRDVGISSQAVFKINNNNFLSYLGSVGKVELSGSNPSPGSFTSIDFKKNYWETTVASDIDDMILDYNDDVTIFGKVDYSNALSSRDTSCSINNPAPCKASFYVAVDTSHIFNLFIVTNSTGVTSNTTYFWDFGDGNTSTKKSPTHQYGNFGKYKLCLTLKDSTTGCSSTFCDSIGLDSAGNVLKANGFTISVIDEGDVLNIEERALETELTAFPNPTSNRIILRYDALRSTQSHVSIYNTNGKLVGEQNWELKTGSNDINLDLSSLPEGLYFIRVQNDEELKTIKILKKL